VPSPYAEEDARRFVLMTIGALAEGTGVHLLAVPDAAPERVLGCVGLSLDPGDRSGELGYWVAPEARGQRVAAHASRALSRYAFDHLDVATIRLLAAIENAASHRVAVAAGFRRVGRLRSGLPDRRPGARPGARLDADLYDLLPADLTGRWSGDGHR
jgi:RimJ/RimL family protein N-acetyltransferase